MWLPSSASSGSTALARSWGTDPTRHLGPVSDGTSLGAVEFDGFGTSGSGAVRASAARIEGVVHDGGTISNTALGASCFSRRRARMEILRHSVSALTMRAKLLLILQARLQCVHMSSSATTASSLSLVTNALTVVLQCHWSRRLHSRMLDLVSIQSTNVLATAIKYCILSGFSAAQGSKPAAALANCCGHHKQFISWLPQ